MSNFDFGRWPGRPWLRWLLVFGAWTFLGALISSEVFVRIRMSGGAPQLPRILAHFLAWTYTWALFTPVILWLRWKFPFTRKRWGRVLVVHLAASLVVASIGSLVWASAGQLLGRIEPGSAVLVRTAFTTFVAFLHFDPLFYWIIIGISYLVQHYHESRERELRASQLETQLAEARLDALEAQLHPHFLFNALNTIAALVRTQKNAQAVRVVAGLAELLRRALDQAGAPLVPLHQEIEFIERYLEIEQIRFGDRLRVRLNISPEAEDACVPYLILQPLVENAIEHGIAPSSDAGLVEVTAIRCDDRLRLSVRDDGVGMQKSAPDGNGVGLTTTRARLQQLYGSDHAFLIRGEPGKGVRAELDIPFRIAADEWQREA